MPSPSVSKWANAHTLLDAIASTHCAIMLTMRISQTMAGIKGMYVAQMRPKSIRISSEPAPRPSQILATPTTAPVAGFFAALPKSESSAPSKPPCAAPTAVMPPAPIATIELPNSLNRIIAD